MTTITDILECRDYLCEVEAVVFDLDDTLYSEKAYVRSGYRAVAAAFPQVEDMETKLWKAFLEKRPAIDAVLESEGIACAENKAKALQAYRKHTPTIALYPGVQQLLEELLRRKKLGMITDGRPEGQWAKIQALQLEKYFDKIIVTDELGGQDCRKPNPMAFQLMQQALEVPFEAMVYIGDNTAKDFQAPEALGMQSIHFCNPDGLYSER